MMILGLTLNIILICFAILAIVGTVFGIKIANLYYKEFVKERFSDE